MSIDESNIDVKLTIHFRYAFRSTEKAALQEIGPRFTLKLRWMKKGLPAVLALGKPSKALEFADEEGEDLPNDNDANVGENQKAAEREEDYGDEMDEDDSGEDSKPADAKKIQPPTQDEYVWMWKVFDAYTVCTVFIV